MRVCETTHLHHHHHPQSHPCKRRGLNSPVFGVRKKLKSS
jgi:hypothetical protein